MNKTLKQIFIILLAGSLLLIAGWSSYHVYRFSTKRAEIKHDYSEINSLTFGLLSVNVWRDNLTTIALNRINDFQFTQQQEDTLKYEVGQLLNAVVNKADSMLEEKQTTLKGKLRKFAIKTFVDRDKIRALVPVFSETIVEEIQKPENKEVLKYVVRTKLEEYSQLTHANSADSLVNDSTLLK